MKMNWGCTPRQRNGTLTKQFVHAVCKNDKGCDLNPLPENPSYSLTKLEQEAEDFITLGGWNLCNNRKMYGNNTVCLLGIMSHEKGIQCLLQVPSC